MFSPLFITGKNAVDVYKHTPFAYGIHLCFALFLILFPNHCSYFFSRNAHARNMAKLLITHHFPVSITDEKLLYIFLLYAN